MTDLNVNFLGNPEPSRKKFFFFLKIAGAILGSIVLFVILVSSNSNSEHSLLASIEQLPIIQRVRQLIHSADRPLSGETGDRINILLLGIGGPGHDGPYLTDTIILASLKPSTGQVALLSVPRDLSVSIPNYGWYKVNHANSFGETQSPGNGGELTSQVLSNTLGVPIHYYVRVDFSGFIQLIDELGGIDVEVDHGFVDTTYPTDHEGEVKTVSFKAGWQHLDGKTALDFARSRHGSNGEGSDFARSRRQQKILLAVKAKVFSLGTLRSPSKINSILTALHDDIKTNFSPWELLGATRLTGSLDTTQLITKVLDDSPDGLLTATTGDDGAYLLVPKKDWDTVRNLVANIFTAGSETAQVKSELVRVEIQNGTQLPGLANRTATLLSQKGYLVTHFGNAKQRDRTQTIIYDLTSGRNPQALDALKELLHAEVAITTPPGLFPDTDTNSQLPNTEVAYAASTKPDFLIIIGTDFQ